MIYRRVAFHLVEAADNLPGQTHVSPNFARGKAVGSFSRSFSRIGNFDPSCRRQRRRFREERVESQFDVKMFYGGSDASSSSRAGSPPKAASNRLRAVTGLS